MSPAMSPAAGWTWMALAIAFEIAGTTSMKLSEGLTKPWPTAAVFACYLCSLTALTKALVAIELSVAYAVWSGVGTAAVSMIGIAVFDEPATWLKLGSLVLIVLGVVGLHLGAGH